MSKQLVVGKIRPFTKVTSDFSQGRFRGPLGLWPWPIVNLLLALVEQIRVRGYGGQAMASSYTNVEEIKWTDWKGRERKIIIHRKAEVE